MKKFNYLCPVCGYAMDEPPSSFNVCPSCGTEFGVNDVNASIPELRQAWIEIGPKWWSVTDKQPENWDPFQQLANLGLASGLVVQASVVTVCATTGAETKALDFGWLQPSTENWAHSVNMQPALV
jgi:hypothetical protein